MEQLKSLWQKINGYKTYLIAAVGVALNFAVYMNWMTVDQLGQVNAVLALLGLGAVRHGISKAK